MSDSPYRHLRLYVAGAWYSYRALFAWFRPSAYLSSKIVYPLFTLMLFLLMGRFAGLADQSYIVIGNILLLTALSGVLGVVMTVGNERVYRTLPYLIGSPAPRVPLFLGRALFNVIDGILTVAAAMALAAVFFGLDMAEADLVMVAACVLLMSLTTSGLGLLLGSVSLVSREGWTISNAAYLALFLLCGANFPVELLPQPWRAVSYALPLTRGMAAARGALAGAGWEAIAPLLAGEALVGLVYALAGYAVFQRIEKWSLASGQIEGL